MPHSLDQILPSLQSLGLWSYWIVGAASMLEAFFVTGIVVPGTLIVDAAGILAQRGVLVFFDLVWFVAIGSVIGGEISYAVGHWGSRRLYAHFNPDRSRSFRRAQDLFDRRGGAALVIGRFLGPVAGFVSFAAALSGMERRRFRVWNILGSVPYTLAHLSLGYYFGDVLARMGPLATRIAVLGLSAAAVLALLVYLVVRIERHLPALLSVGGDFLDALARLAPVQAWAGRHPRLGGLIARRMDRTHFFGLPATLLGVAFLYVFFVYLGSVLDFLLARPIVQVDTRLAQLLHVFWDPRLLAAAAHVTALGDWRVIALLVVAGCGALALMRAWPLAAGLVVSVVGNAVTVAVLKLIFHRPRPELAYFVETSGSFPSGHAAISAACYGMLCYAAWRVRLLGPMTAPLLGVFIAFLIGASRLYLIEHYLSDVLNGYLVGTLWLLIGVAVGEWLQTLRRGPHGNIPRGARMTALALCILAAGGAGAVTIGYSKARNLPAGPAPIRTVTDVASFFATGRAPGWSETIAGRPLAPIAAVLVAPDTGTVEKTLRAAGFVPTQMPGLGSISRALFADWSGRPDPAAPPLPAFWNARPDTRSYVASQAPAQPRLRRLVRLWPTRWRDGTGGRIFVATLTLSDPRPLEAAEAAPRSTRADRAGLAAALRRTGHVTDSSEIAIRPPKGSHAGPTTAELLHLR